MTSPDTRLAALREQLLGSWRMISWTRMLSGTGEESDALGPDPIGYINYAPDGRVMVLVLRKDRPKPASIVPSESEKVGLYDTMAASLELHALHGTCSLTPGRARIPCWVCSSHWRPCWRAERQARDCRRNATAGSCPRC